MSTILTDKEGVKARKPYHCTFCGESIPPGSLYDYRTGTDGYNQLFTMRMHPECNAYASAHWDTDWEEDLSEPAFERPKVEEAAVPATTPS